MKTDEIMRARLMRASLLGENYHEVKIDYVIGFSLTRANSLHDDHLEVNIDNI